MKILLINSNPVVSRLTALSARKEDIQIDEIQEVGELSSNQYDIVFVDADSWNTDIDNEITKKIQTQKKVLFYAQDDKGEQDLFDMSILKPFLPSEVSAVIRSVEEYDLTKSSTEEVKEEKHFDALANSEGKKDDFLISLNDDLDFDLDEKVKPTLKEEPKPKEKEEISLKPDKAEKVDFEELSEESFNAQLEKAFPPKENTLDNELIEESKSKIETKAEILPVKKETELFDLDLDSDIELNNELFSLDDKKTEANDLLDLDLDSKDELDFTLESTDIAPLVIPEKKEVKEISVKAVNKEIPPVEEKEKETKVVEKKEIETKILDELEVANIKDILENENREDVGLENLITPSVPEVNLRENVKPKKKKSKKEKKSSSDTLADTLSSLPVESLKGLLAGANIKINIKFPKVK